MRTQLRLAVPLAAIVVAAIVVAGCVSIAAPPKEQVIGHQQVSSKSYTLGVAAEAFVGNDVIRVKDYSLTRVATDEVEVQDTFTFDGPLFGRSFKAGARYPYAGTATHDGKTYDVMRVEHAGLMFDADGHIANKLISGFGNPMTPPVVMIYTYDVTPPEARLRRVVREGVNRESFGQNYGIAFSGVTRDSIRLTYREYVAEDLSRAASSQELTYPIGSRTIRFRNLVIDVLEVKPDRLKYRVTSDTGGANP